MILFTILLCTLIMFAIILAVATGIVGTAAILAFGDLIVCALIVYLIIKLLFRRKK